MFSGLTNQVSSWMGAVKGDPHDEEVPTPPNTASAVASDPQPSSVQPEPEKHESPVDTTAGITDENGQRQR